MPNPSIDFDTIPFGVGNSPISVKVGDFNGDRQQDLVVANRDANTLSILLGDGTGGFGTQTTFDTQRAPNAIALGDFNGDGRQDIATTNRFSNSVSVLLGNGTGGFSTQTAFAVGIEPNAIAIGDFNGDGRQDLAATNLTSNTVSILLGNGTGGFSPQTTFATGAAPGGVVVGDFNGDRQQDLAVSNLDSNTMSVLLGNGAGGFSPQTTFATGATPRSIALADLNGDGRQDLAIANRDASTVSILLGNGTGGFSPQTTFATGAAPRSIVLGDFNGDGRQDLATANRDGQSVSILLGNGSGAFDAAQTFRAGVKPHSVAVGDFNGDGRQDLVSANRGSNSVSLLLSVPPPETIAPVLPAVRITSNNPNPQLARVGNTVTLSFSASEALSGLPRVTIDGNVATVANTGANNYTATYRLQAGDTEGQVPFRINFTDGAGNSGTPVTATTNASRVLFDRTPPTVTLNQDFGQADPTSGETVTYTAIFSEPVTGFAPEDVALGSTVSGNPTVTVTPTSTNGRRYAVTVSGLAGTGTVLANVPAGVVFDAAGNPNLASTSTDNSVAFDDALLTVSSIARANANPTAATEVNYTVTFSDSVTGVDATDFQLVADGLANPSILNVTGSDRTWTVTASTGTGTGTLALNLVDDDSIANTAAVPLGGAGIGNGNATGQIYTVDRTPPTATASLADVTAAGPASYQFSVTYSDNIAINAASLDGFDVQASGPNGFVGAASFIGSRTETNGISRRATYQFTPPGGTWDVLDNGSYAITVTAAQVSDTTGNTVVAGTLGTFSVAIADVTSPVALGSVLPSDSVEPDPNFDACLLVTNPPVFPPLNLTANTLTGGVDDDFIEGDDNGNTISGEAGGDTLIGYAGADNIQGNTGNDVLFGNRNADAIDGGEGEDLVFAGKNNDEVRGNLGNDIIAGELGNDLLLGNEGDDIAFGNRGIDYIDGGVGADWIFAGKDNDGVSGGDGEDTIAGELGNDCLHGRNGNDILFGNVGADVLFGGNNDDLLFGGKADDLLLGGEGNDVLKGDLGNDTLTGGTGGDRFDFRPIDGTNLITDFNLGMDIIGLADGLRFEDLTIAPLGNETLITAGELSVTLLSIDASVLGSANFALV
ncbi:MAG: FG-GAP-like repeat-containing protein [Cyanobacteriota bacterium]|nr:FG-GAP-like repeat-containing protein [Cyanobacteriota bacterium]